MVGLGELSVSAYRPKSSVSMRFASPGKFARNGRVSSLYLNRHNSKCTTRSVLMNLIRINPSRAYASIKEFNDATKRKCDGIHDLCTQSFIEVLQQGIPLIACKSVRNEILI